MTEERTSSRTFFSAPQSVTSLVAAFLEPLLSVCVYLAVLLAQGGEIARADLVLCLLLFALSFPGRNRFRERRLNAAVDIIFGWIALLAILAFCAFATQSFEFFDPLVVLWWAALVPAAQWLAFDIGRVVVKFVERRPDNRRVAVVVGGGVLGVKVARALRAHEAEGLHFAGYFDDREGGRLDAEASHLQRGRLADLAAFVGREGVHEVYMTMPLSSQPRIAALLEQLQGTTASLYFVPDVFGVQIIQGRLRDMNGVPVVGLCDTPFTGTHALVKRTFDIVLAALVLVLLAPLMLAIALGVRLSSSGPVIFRQRRNGLGGEEIVVYKFRTMRTLEDGPHVAQASRGDPRVTRFGGFLRRTSLDELPQFVNVLQGRMSVVGPRPHAVAHNESYRQIIRAYMVRHKVRPGITGWAQIHGHRGETDTVDKMRARVEHDLEYLRNWSLALDIRIIARTLRLIAFDRQAY